jgi:hypothetical protein
MWLCTHCDLQQEAVQQTVGKRRDDELLRVPAALRADGNLLRMRGVYLAAPGGEHRGETVSYEAVAGDEHTAAGRDAPLNAACRFGK